MDLQGFFSSRIPLRTPWCPRYTGLPRRTDLRPGVPLDLGVGVRRASLPRRRGCRRPTRADDLHVLLRHRLLRQPHGFEGFGPRVEDAPPDALPVAAIGPTCQIVSLAGMPLPAPWPRMRRPRPSGRQVAHLDNLDGAVGEDVEQVSSTSGGSRHGRDSCPPWPTARGTPSTSSSISARRASRSRRLKASYGSVSELHVLLRHRPRSIPQAQESA